MKMVCLPVFIKAVKSTFGIGGIAAFFAALLPNYANAQMLPTDCPGSWRQNNDLLGTYSCVCQDGSLADMNPGTGEIYCRAEIDESNKCSFGQCESSNDSDSGQWLLNLLSSYSESRTRRIASKITPIGNNETFFSAKREKDVSSIFGGMSMAFKKEAAFKSKPPNISQDPFGLDAYMKTSEKVGNKTVKKVEILRNANPTGQVCAGNHPMRVMRIGEFEYCELINPLE